MTATGRRGRPVTGRPFENTDTPKAQVPHDGDTASRLGRVAELPAKDRRLVLTVRTFLRWRTFAVGDAPGVTFADSHPAWQIDALAHTFGVAAGGWGNALHAEAAA